MAKEVVLLEVLFELNNIPFEIPPFSFSEVLFELKLKGLRQQAQNSSSSCKSNKSEIQ